VYQGVDLDSLHATGHALNPLQPMGDRTALGTQANQWAVSLNPVQVSVYSFLINETAITWCLQNKCAAYINRHPIDSQLIKLLLDNNDLFLSNCRQSIVHHDISFSS